MSSVDIISERLELGFTGGGVDASALDKVSCQKLYSLNVCEENSRAFDILSIHPCQGELLEGYTQTFLLTLSQYRKTFCPGLSVEGCGDG